MPWPAGGRFVSSGSIPCAVYLPPEPRNMPTTVANAKTCYACGRLLALGEFPFRSAGRGTRQGRCRDCRNRYMQLYRQGRRRAVLGRFAVELARSGSVSRVVALCNAMVGRFGGIDGLATAWRAAVETAARQQPGGRVLLNSLRAILRLVEVSAALHPLPEPSDLSDGDIEARNPGVAFRPWARRGFAAVVR